MSINKINKIHDINTEIAYNRRIVILHYIVKNTSTTFTKLYAIILKISKSLYPS